MADKENLSIKEIAQLAGTSVATVSRVINHKGRYSADTERRVMEVIHKYNYRPNMLAKSLRTDNLKVVGLIVTDLLSEYFMEIIREIERTLMYFGYITVMCDTYESEDAEKQYIDVLSNLRFSGIIYIGGKRSKAVFKDFPVVYVDRAPDAEVREKDSCYIGSDNYKTGYLAASTLLKSGRKNPSIVLFQEHLATQTERLKGFCQAITDHGIPFNRECIFYASHVDYESGQQVTGEILKLSPRYDSVFYTSDILAIGGLQYLKGKNIGVPKDISLISVDDIPRSARTSPGLTTVRQHYRTFGRLAAESMIKLINGETVHDHILDVEVIRRDTV